MRNRPPVDPDNAVRNEELCAVLAHFNRSGTAHGQIIDIVGEPGMGKTALLATVSRHCQNAGWTVLRVRYSARNRSEPLGPLATALGDHLTEVEVRGDQLRRHAAARTALTRLNPHRVVLVLDDFHLADEESVELVENLAHAPINGPLVIVIARRSRRSPRTLVSALAHGVELGTVHRVALPPLTIGQAMRVLGRDTEDDAMRALHAESGGNPLYLLALAYAKCPDTPRTHKSPAHITALLTDELRTLSDQDRLVLDALAVLDEDMPDLDLLAEVAGLDREDANRALDTLVASDVLRHQDGPGIPRFRHPVLRRATYTDIAAGARADLHRRAKLALAERTTPTGILARHIERSIAHATPQDPEILAAAADEVAQQAPEQAAHWLCTAIGITDDGGERAELTLRLARVTAATGELDDSVRIAAKAARLASEDNLRLATDAVRHQATVLCLAGNYVEANTILEEHLATLPGTARAEVAQVVVRQAFLSLLGGPPVPVDRIAELGAHAETNDIHTRVGVLAVRGLQEVLDGNCALAAQTLTACARDLDGLPGSRTRHDFDSPLVLGYGEMLMGWLHNAERHMHRALEAGRQAGVLGVEAAVVSTLGAVADLLGDLPKAVERYRRAAQLAQEAGARCLHDFAAAAGHLTLTRVGALTDPSIAVASTEQVVIDFPRQSTPFAQSMTMWLQAVLDAGADVRRCVRVVLNGNGGAALTAFPAALRPRIYELLTSATLGEEGEAADWAARATREARRQNLPHQHGWALLASAHVARAEGNPRLGRVLYRQAADQFSLTDMALPRAQAILLAGLCEIEAGNAREGRALLVDAERRALGCGAVSLATLAREHLDSGPQPAAGKQEPLSTLTKRESEVAAIAATGKRTKEIAQQLRMSPRTVDVHLTRIYQKLNLTSRAQLIRLMASS
ncbi:helix-turn-helix transcriptional regulator [Saccharothrix obliqua]|uniref:helix-turn-helix transcriptional regulator n=1 Tax=Saccharothrix obliqua TaxID=2861747 RepID=UPI001C5D2493|nr:LuxR C-terminal-related transcriptional regulator [Saccharothrix obliqua]MBW4717853.1 LuxR C-terminal-related transcriptional regulator [Saccharothrix obliqua]